MLRAHLLQHPGAVLAPEPTARDRVDESAHKDFPAALELEVVVVQAAAGGAGGDDTVEAGAPGDEDEAEEEEDGEDGEDQGRVGGVDGGEVGVGFCHGVYASGAVGGCFVVV